MYENRNKSEYWLRRKYSLKEANYMILCRKRDSKRNRIARKNNTYMPRSKTKTLERFVEIFGMEYGTREYNRVIQHNIEQTKQEHIRKKADPNWNPKEHNQRCKEHWLAKGLTLEQSKEKVRKVQARGLDYFVTKYGEQEGTKRWKQRQIAWQKTLNRSDREATRQEQIKNAHVGYYTDKTVSKLKSLGFYIVEFIDKDKTRFLKYGLTKCKDVHRRWKSIHKVHYFKHYSPAIVALKIEQHNNHGFNSDYKPVIIKTKECCLFTEENLEILLLSIDGLDKYTAG